MDPLLLRATSVPYQISLHWLMAGHATSNSALELYVVVEGDSCRPNGMTSTKDDFDRGVEGLVTVLLSVGAHSWAVAPSFSAVTIAAMHYSRIQNVTPADSRGIFPVGASCSPGGGRAWRGPSSRLSCLASETGGPPVLSTRCLGSLH